MDKNIDSLETLWRRAAAAGYTHVLLADSKFSRLGEMDARYFKNIDREAHRCQLKMESPALFSVGYRTTLSLDVNLIEGPPVKDLPLAAGGPPASMIPTRHAAALSDLKKWSEGRRPCRQRDRARPARMESRLCKS